MRSNRRLWAVIILFVLTGVFAYLIQQIIQTNTRPEDKVGISLHTVGVFKGPKENTLTKPLGVAVGENGEVYVADSSNHRVVVFSMEGKMLRIIGGPGTAPGSFDYPTAVVTFGPRLYVADTGKKSVQVYNTEGRFLRLLDTGAVQRGVKPLALAMDSIENLYVADGGGQRILVYNSQGKLIKSFGSQGTGEGEFGFPNGLALDEKGKRIFVSDFSNGRIQVFNWDGKFQYQIKGEELLTNPRGISFDSDRGLLFVADIFQHRIAVLQANGDLVGYFGSIGSSSKQFQFPNGLYFHKQTLYVADRDNNRIVVIHKSGKKGGK